MRLWSLFFPRSLSLSTSLSPSLPLSISFSLSLFLSLSLPPSFYLSLSLSFYLSPSLFSLSLSFLLTLSFCLSLSLPLQPSLYHTHIYCCFPKFLRGFGLRSSQFSLLVNKSFFSQKHPIGISQPAPAEISIINKESKIKEKTSAQKDDRAPEKKWDKELHENYENCIENKIDVWQAMYTLCYTD